jgi:hypothetical protein
MAPNISAGRNWFAGAAALSMMRWTIALRSIAIDMARRTRTSRIGLPLSERTNGLCSRWSSCRKMTRFDGRTTCANLSLPRTRPRSRAAGFSMMSKSPASRPARRGPALGTAASRSSAQCGFSPQ